MKKGFILTMMLAMATIVIAQEYATREVRINEGTPVTIGTGAPIDVTLESSEVWLKYGSAYQYYFAGDCLTGLVFTGYNPGKEMERHFTVQMSTGTSLNFVTVFDGNCTIPHGGTEDACIPLITIDFAAPLVVDLGFLQVKVTCTGEAAETPVFF